MPSSDGAFYMVENCRLS